MIRHGGILEWLVVAVLSQGGSVDKEYSEALAHYTRGDWKEAVRGLGAVAPRLVNGRRRAVAFKQLGVARLELGQKDGAAAAFVQALTADPLVDTDAIEDPPHAIAAFRATRERLDGTLNVTASRPNARLFVDGRDWGALPQTVRVRIGRRRVRAKTADGHFAGEAVVVVGVGQEVHLPLKLKARVAFLSVAGADGGVTVSIDGVALGRSPLTRVAVAPGKRDVVMSRAGYETKVTPVDFVVGEEQRIKGTLTKVVLERPGVGKRPDEARGGRATRAWGWVAAATGLASFVTGAALYFGATEPSRDTRAGYNGGVDAFNTRVKVGAGLMAGAGVCAAGAAALFLLHKNPAPRQAVRIGIAPVGFSNGFGVTLAIQP